MLIGARSHDTGATEFINNLGCGATAQTGWAIAYGADSSSVAAPLAMGGFKCAVSFSTSSAMVPRCTFTGTAKAGFYRGKYRVFLRAQQLSGANGDTAVQLRIQIGGSTTAFPSYVLPLYTMQAHDIGYELCDLTGDGYLSIPFAQTVATDNSAQDLVFMVMAQKNTGASTLDISDLILIPVDEFALDLRDPISDTTNGTSALRGASILHIDGGIMANRTVKMNVLSNVNYPAETWIRGGDISKLEPNTRYKIYFLSANYPANWGVGPLVSSPTNGTEITIYGHSTFQALRGGA
jgi:hypothetical protein